MGELVRPARDLAVRRLVASLALTVMIGPVAAGCAPPGMIPPPRFGQQQRPATLAFGGFVWQRLELAGSGTQWVNGVAAGPAGFVVAGSTISPADDVTGPHTALVWFSPDGRRWEQVRQPDVFNDRRGLLDQVILDVAAGPNGFVAAGFEAPHFRAWETPHPNPLTPAVWLSSDGRHWKRDPTSRGMPAKGWDATVTHVAVGAHRTVAVGYETAKGHEGEVVRGGTSPPRRPVIWVWDGGAGWHRSWTGQDGQWLEGVITIGDTLVAFGSAPRGQWAGKAGLLLVSADGTSWERLAGDWEGTNDVFSAGEGDSSVATLLTAHGNTWLSSDGRGWHRGAELPDQRYEDMESKAVVRVDERLVAVGMRFPADGHTGAVLFVLCNGNWEQSPDSEAMFGGKRLSVNAGKAAVRTGTVVIAGTAPAYVVAQRHARVVVWLGTPEAGPAMTTSSGHPEAPGPPAGPLITS